MTQGTGGYNLGGTPIPAQGTGGIGGFVGNLLGGNGTEMQGPPQQQYGQALNQAGNNQLSYFNQGQNYSQNAPTITNPYQAQSQAALQQTYANQGANAAAYQAYGNSQQLAQSQYQQALDQSTTAQLSAARNARANQVGLAGMQAATTGQQQQAAAAGQAGTTQAQVQATGLQGAGQGYGQMGGLQLSQYGLEEQTAEQQAQLQSQNQAQQNAMQLGLYGLSNQYGGMQLQGLNQYTQGLEGAEGLGVQAMGSTAALGGQLVSGGLGGLQAGLQYGAMQNAGGGSGGGQWQQGSGGVGTQAGIGPGY